MPDLAAELRRSEPEEALAGKLRMFGHATIGPEAAQVVRQHHFDASRKWRFDFAWPDLRVAVEVEGGSWVGGDHVRGKRFELDCIKYDEAAIAGWLVLRVTTAMVGDDRAINLIERAIRSRRRPPADNRLPGLAGPSNVTADATQGMRRGVR